MTHLLLRQALHRRRHHRQGDRRRGAGSGHPPAHVERGPPAVGGTEPPDSHTVARTSAVTPPPRPGHPAAARHQNVLHAAWNLRELSCLKANGRCRNSQDLAFCSRCLGHMSKNASSGLFRLCLQLYPEILSRHSPSRTIYDVMPQETRMDY